MNYLIQFSVILAVSFAGEMLSMLLPLPVPASVWGLVIMLSLLFLKVINPHKINKASSFLLETMPVMFIPTAAEVIVSWNDIKAVLLPAIIIIFLSTFIVMIVSGAVTEAIINSGGKKND